MDWTQTEWNHMRENQSSAMNVMYQNTGASHFERIQRNSLILDVSSPSSDGSFNVELHEPLKIDKLSDVYLDSFTTLKANVNTATNKIAFLLQVNEFNIDSTSNETKIHNKIMIPNGATDPNTCTTHKGSKFNYICSINPDTISRLSGTMTDLDGGDAFHGVSDPKRFIAEFVIVARE